MYLAPDSYSLHRCGSTQSPLRIETLLEKGSSDINEDVLLVQEEAIFGVFDGATSLDPRRFQGGKSGGYLAANLAAQTFRQSEDDLYNTAVKANERIFLAQQKEHIAAGDRHLLWSTGMAVVRIGENSLEYCQTGDCLIMLLHQDGNYTLPVRDHDFDRETLQLLKAHTQGGVSRDTVTAQIRKVRMQMNRSYGVLNGEAVAVDFIRHGFVDLDDVTDILIFTDGLFLPKENPDSDHDWDRFTQLYRSGGLQGLRQYVRTRQSADDSIQKYPRFKCHDDIAAVAVTRNSHSQPHSDEPAAATAVV